MTSEPKPHTKPVSASALLREMEQKAVLSGLRMPTPDYMNVAGDLIDVLPELAALVEAAEDPFLVVLESHPKAEAVANAEMARAAKRLRDSLAALARKLGDRG